MKQESSEMARLREATDGLYEVQKMLQCISLGLASHGYRPMDDYELVLSSMRRSVVSAQSAITWVMDNWEPPKRSKS